MDASRRRAWSGPLTAVAAVGLGAVVLVAQEAPITEYRLPPDALARSEALYRTTIAMTVVGTVYGLALLVALLYGRVAPRYRDLAERVSRRRFVQALVFVPLLLVTIDVLSLPVSLYGHSLQLRYGLSVQGWPSWFWDWTKGELLGVALGTVLVWGLYVFLRRSPTRWWLYGWLAAIPVVLLLVLIGPIVIAPMFDTFTPLETRQPALVPELEKVLARGGVAIERARMFEMQASDKVTTYNAYVTGIGASKRVVVWDNTSRDLSVPETLFVFGHEMGHYVLQHVWWTLGVALAALLVQLYLAYRLLGGLLARWGPRWAIRDAADWASFPVVLVLLSVFGLVAQPAAAAFSRSLEHQADIYGLEVVHGVVPDASQAAAHAFQKLGEKALTYPTPHPLFVFWAFSHPPVNERLRFAATYRPWDRGEPRRYVQ
ncbi:MAG: M48 family metallopeptidase [Vicinamibacterales bacterium]